MAVIAFQMYLCKVKGLRERKRESERERDRQTERRERERLRSNKPFRSG